MIAGNHTSTSASSPAARQQERRALGVAGGAHALHDGYTDLIYVMLPIWQAEFGLAYAEIGLLRGLYAGTMAAFQIPAGLISERYGAGTVLALGTDRGGFVARAYVCGRTSCPPREPWCPTTWVTD